MPPISEPGPKVCRVPLGGVLPQRRPGEVGVVLTLSRALTAGSERDRIARWIAGLRCGASIHWAPDGPLWEDAVDFADIDGWSEDGAEDHTTLTCRVSADLDGLWEAMDLLPGFLSQFGPSLILDIGGRPHRAEIAVLRQGLRRGR